MNSEERKNQRATSIQRLAREISLEASVEPILEDQMVAVTVRSLLWLGDELA